MNNAYGFMHPPIRRRPANKLITGELPLAGGDIHLGDLTMGGLAA